MDILKDKINLEIFKPFSDYCEVCFEEFDQNE